MARKIEFFPMTQTERDLVAFLLEFSPKLDSETEFLQSLLRRQQGTISYRQRIKLWKIPTKYQFPVSTPWPHLEVLTTISCLIEAMEIVHKAYWSDRVAEELKKRINRHLEEIADRRVDWLQDVIDGLDAEREDVVSDLDEIPF